MKERKEYNVFAGGKHHAEKYDNNPIHRKLINGFMNSLIELSSKTDKKCIFEIGCGEGQLLGVLHENGYEVSGMDLDEDSVAMTKTNLATVITDGDKLVEQGNLYDIDKMSDRINGKMLICCEVLEHVPDPEKGLKLISENTDEFFIVSVPREPLWRFLNMARGKYWSDLGNTPGHINHWSKNRFLKLVSKYGEVVEVKSPLPWTMVLARVKKGE